MPTRPRFGALRSPVLTLRGHKYTRGHVVAVSGGASTTGAARLAARGALRAGAGLVTIASPREALAINAAESLAVMVRAIDGPAELGEFVSDRRRNAVVLGPGGGVGSAMREQVLATLASAASVVLDADALTSFAEHQDLLAGTIRKRPGPVVLTPHQGEFSRIFNDMFEDHNPNSKLDKTRLAAEFCGAIVVYKGADTVVAAPDGRATIAENGPPSLATAGSGDVLSGIICGLMAQGMPAFEAACAGVWLHGDAASEFGPGLIAEDLPEMLPRVYRRLLAGLGEGQVDPKKRQEVMSCLSGRPRVKPSQIAARTVRNFDLCGRGGIGRRSRFRSCRRKVWGFESLRPHQKRPMRLEKFAGSPVFRHKRRVRFTESRCDARASREKSVCDGSN